MNLEQQLREALAPCAPGAEPETAIMVRVSAAAWRASQVSRRSTGRWFVIGTLLAVAAAAAMLALRHRDAPAPQAAVVVPVAAPVVEAVAQVAAPLPAAPVSPAPPPVAERPTPTEAVTPFTVFVPPLLSRDQDAASRAAAESFQALFLDVLRAVPGVVLLGPEENTAAAEAAARYRITLLGIGPLSGNRFSVNVANGIKTPTGFIDAGSVVSYSVDLASACGGPAMEGSASCNDAASVVARAVNELRKKVFPADPALRRQLQAQLVDPVLDYGARLRALVDLGGLKGLAANALGDPVAMRGATDLAFTATDPAVRAQVWRTLRGVGSAGLVQPLLRALRQEPDREVRLEALSTLSTDFIDNAEARAALETVVREDASPLVRAVAQRGLSGDEAWTDYVVASLKDSSRSDAERVEALIFHVVKPGSSSGSFTLTYPSPYQQLLTDEVVQALAQVLPGVVGSPDMQKKTHMLLMSTGVTGRPDMADALLGIVDKVTYPQLRQLIVRGLGRNTGARARAALEKISTQDADPELRRIAAQILNSYGEPAPR